MRIVDFCEVVAYRRIVTTADDRGLPELTAACPDTAAARETDVIGGRPARYVAAPASTGEAAALLRAAAGLGLTVVPRGAGCLQHWGSGPDSCDLIVDTHRLDRITEHRPADFTVTVQAGVRLPDLEKTLEAAGQSLRLIPPRRAHRGTIGGLLATNAAGMLAFRYGTPRDHLLGVTAVLADGSVTRGTAGVPTSAGHDLPRLLAGSYGTLGLITEATVRVYPLPGGSAGVGITCAGPDEAARIIGVVGDDPWLAVAGINLYWAAADEPIRVSVLVERNSQDYQDRVNRVYALAGRTPPAPPDPAAAIRLDAPDHGGLPPAVAQKLLAHRERMRAEMLDPPAETGTLVRASFPPQRLAAALTAIRATAAACGLPAMVRGPAGVGFLDVTIPAGPPAASVARFVTALRTGREALAAAVVYAPDDVRELPGPGDRARPLTAYQAVKDELDPGHRMAPGRTPEPAA